jgi:U4/U6.U5 tri-snRNP-associated protein 2
MHLEKGTFHCLPDDYTIHDASLNDIRAALQPTFTSEQIQSLDGNSEPSRDLFGRRYLPGFVGLSNLNKTDGINCVVQALAHVRPLRNYFLSQSNHNTLAINNAQNQLSIQVTHAFGQLVRKLWSPDRFKSNVDPHELVHYISVASKKRFGVGQQCEVGDLMTWLLHHFHVGTGGTKKPNSSIIHTTFQGQLRMTTKEKKRKRVQDQSNEDDRGGSDAESDREDEFKMENSVKQQEPEFVLEESIVDTQFLQLTLDLPDKPLFRDEDGGLVIPQEPLSTVLKKFDGISFSDAVTKSGVSQRKQYRLLKLPDYLILCLARFKKNSYTRVKNPAIVAFPLKNLDLSEYVKPDGGRKSIPTQEQVEQMGVSISCI